MGAGTVLAGDNTDPDGLLIVNPPQLCCADGDGIPMYPDDPEDGDGGVGMTLVKWAMAALLQVPAF